MNIGILEININFINFLLLYITSLFLVSINKKQIRAIIEPKCIVAIISRVKPLVEKNLSKIIRCNDELTGINSVIPSKIEASKKSINLRTY